MLQESSEKLTDRPIAESYWVIPGKLLAGEYPGSPLFPERSRARIEAFLQAGFNAFVDLTNLGETGPYEPILRELAHERGIQAEYLHFPIGDYGLPTIDGMKTALDAIDEAIERGRKVYLHCYGGIGRTGTTVGCFLARHGQPGEQALEQLAQWWQDVPKHTRYPHSPETIAQEQFVRNWVEAG